MRLGQQGTQRSGTRAFQEAAFAIPEKGLHTFLRAPTLLHTVSPCFGQSFSSNSCSMEGTFGVVPQLHTKGAMTNSLASFRPFGRPTVWRPLVGPVGFRRLDPGSSSGNSN